MRYRIVLALLLASTAFAQQDPVPNPRIAQMIANLSRTQTPRESALAPNGKWLAWTVDGSLHFVATGSLTSDQILSPQPKTPYSNACFSTYPVWSADSARLAFLSNCDGKGGIEKRSQIWLFDPLKNSYRQLTHLTGLISKPQFSPDGKTLAFLFTPNATRAAGATDAMKPAVGVIGRDNVEVQTIEMISAEGGTSESFGTVGEGLYIYEFSWAPDSRRLVYIAAPPPGENNWWVAKLYMQSLPMLYAYPGPVPAGRLPIKPEILVDPTTIPGPLHGLQIALPRFSPDGNNIAFIGGLMSDFGVTGGDLYIVKADGPNAGKDTHPFTAGRKASIAWFQWTDPDHVAITEREGGRVHLAILGTSGAQMPWFSQYFDGTLSAGTSSLSLSVSLATHSVAAVRSSFDHAPEVWYGAPNNLHQVSHLNDALEPAWGKAESIEYTNEGFHIQGFLLYPAHYDSAKRYGLVTYVHGGPSSATSNAWPSTSFGPAPFSAMDYFVFMPNFRGSFGQGEDFTQANRKDFGHGDLRDILVGLDVVEKRFPIDTNRIGITGWSYGGFMTMFATTQTDRFKAAVAGAGISNWQSYYGQNSIDQWMVPFFGSTVYQNPEIYAKSSPITYIKNAKTPTLLVVGDRDGECPAPQSFEFWHALRAFGVDTELVVYPGEGHHFRDPAHRIDVLTRALDWFDSRMPVTGAK
ncbi:MAG: prolyl oligopeptidase family serine peptidase [Acidobacteria bacterium]|nr:prolyl oligopeptidase family serine peptidase [Acidobacteriota bacterium]